MTTTNVSDPTGTPVAETEQARPSRLATVVALAVLCRDNGIDWPRDVDFSDEYPNMLSLYASSAGHVALLAEAIGLPARATRYTKQSAHHVASGKWLGYDVDLRHIAPLPEPVAPVDDATSATIDDLAATVRPEPGPETEALIAAALAVPVELVDEDEPPRSAAEEMAVTVHILAAGLAVGPPNPDSFVLCAGCGEPIADPDSDTVVVDGDRMCSACADESARHGSIHTYNGYCRCTCPDCRSRVSGDCICRDCTARDHAHVHAGGAA